MNELEKYHDHAGGQEIINLQIPPEPGIEARSDLVAGILRRWYIVFLVFLVLCGAGLPAVWLYIQPVYNVTGAIRVAPVVQKIIDGEVDGGGISNYESFMNTQAEKVTSSAVVQRVADALADKNLSFFESGFLFNADVKLQSDLDNDIISEKLREEFGRNETPLSQHDVTVTVKEKGSEWVIADGAKRYSVRKKGPGLNIYEDEGTGLLSVLKQKLVGKKKKLEPADRLQLAIVSEKAIVVAADRRSELIKITMRNTDPKEAQRIVDAFITAYYNIEVLSAVEDENQRLKLLADERDRRSGQIENYRLTIHQLGQQFGDRVLEGRRDMMLGRVAELLNRLTTAEAERIDLEAQVQLLERTKSQPISPAELLQMRQDYINRDPAVLAFMPIITQLEQELIVAKQTYQPMHAELRSKTENLAALKAHLKELKQEASDAFDDRVAKEAAEAGQKNLLAKRSELEQKRLYEERLRETIDKEDTETITVGRTQLDILDLQDKLDFAKERYDVVVGRIQDLELQRGRPPRITVHYDAEIASINNKRTKLSAAVIFAALVCGMGLAYLRDKADQSLRTPDDVAKRIGIRIIGTTTSLNTVKPAFLPEQIVGDYQTIRANLGLLGENGVPRKLVVTSPGMKEGKTTFAVNLATSMAESGKRVLLIDGDLRKPDVARLLNLPKGTRGLQDVLCGVKFDQAVFSMPSTGLDVLAADFDNTADAYELLAMPSTAKRIEMISRKYDHVIIDTPPTLGFPDALVWAKIGGAAILVSYAGHTTMPDLREAKERLAQINVQVLGTVLSSVQAGHGYYRHGHGYYTQSAQSREAAGLHRRKLLFSMDESLDDADDLDAPQGS